MKMHKNLLVIFILLFVSLAMTFAAPITEQMYQKLQDIDFNSTSLDEIISQYDKFYNHLNKGAEGALNEMAKARKNNDKVKYNEAYKRLEQLSKYKMSEQESNRILEKILAEAEDKQLESAIWLYERSSYYRPTLSIDFSINEPNYRFSYTKRLQQKPGTQIRLPSASEINVDRNKVGILAGWSLSKDSLTYKEGEMITMPLKNQTLYAHWQSAVQIIDKVTDLDISKVGLKEGSSIELPILTPPNPSYRFLGFYDYSKGKLLDKNQRLYTVSGKGSRLEALWKSISVEAISPLYMGFDRLAKNVPIRVGFMLHNQGNTNVGPLRVTLSSEDESVEFVNKAVTIRELPPFSYRTNNSRYATKARSLISGESNTFTFIINEKAISNSEIPFKLTIFENDEVIYSTEVIFKVR